MGFRSRDYQIACEHAILREWGMEPFWDGERATSQRTIANLPTSSGKTIIAAHLTRRLVEEHGARVLYVADRDELIQQPVEKFHKACSIIAGVHRGKDHVSGHADVVIGSLQTLVNRLPPGRPFTHIIDDEAHRNTEARAQIHAQYPEAKVVGITATAFRKGLADLSKWYPTVAFELGTFDMVEQGYITPIKVLTLPLEVDISGVRQTMSAEGKDYDQKQVASIMEPHYRALARSIKENPYTKDRTILAFLPLISSSQEFAEIWTGEGINTKHCDGKTKDRKGMIEAFERGDFQCLTNSQVFSTGVDFIRCDAMLNLACTKSRVEYRQRAGRIMRLIPGTIDPGGVTMPLPELRRAAIAKSVKPDCLIIDLMWQTSKIGLAGPAAIFAGSEEEEEAIGKKLRKQRTPEELAQVREDFRIAKEEELREAIAAEALKQATKGARAAAMIDARQLMLDIQRDLIDYEPVMPWEMRKVSDKQAAILEKIGVNPDNLESAGIASKLIDAVKSRQKEGMAPVEAFTPLRKLGVEHPETMTLNDSIRKLGHEFPMTWSKLIGTPLCEVKKSFWSWFWFKAPPEVRDMVKEKHQACWRYVTKIVFPGRLPGYGSDLPKSGTLEIDAATGKLIPGSIKGADQGRKCDRCLENVASTGGSARFKEWICFECQQHEQAKEDMRRDEMERSNTY